MREIKFRIWLEKQKKYLTNDEQYILPIISQGKLLVGIDDTHKMFMGDILEQYTGLKDKNGVEIYEGDRVEFPKGFHADKKGENAYRHYLIDEVVFTNGAFHFKKEHMTISFDIDKAEIIGNIHNDSQR